MADRVGQQLGNYRLIRLLGRGGFAEVYLGEHIHLNTQAAVKVLHTQLASDEADKFRNEARMLAHLTHPHIVRVFDFDVKDGTPFLIMDHASNGTLRQRHPRGVILPVATVILYLKQIAEALQYAHDKMLIHRDIKPENMLLGRLNEVLLSDFGIATVAQSSQAQHTQAVLGTATYMAPEQIQGKPRPASDQYALGVVVYEWLCGDRPFHGSFVELTTQHMYAPPPLLHEKIRTISPVVEQVVLTALEKDPHKRFASVKAFATAIEQAFLPSPIRVNTPIPHKQPTHGTTPVDIPIVTPPGMVPALPKPSLSNASWPTFSISLDERRAISSGKLAQETLGTTGKVFDTPLGPLPIATVMTPPITTKLANIQNLSGLPGAQGAGSPIINLLPVGQQAASGMMLARTTRTSPPVQQGAGQPVANVAPGRMGIIRSTGSPATPPKTALSISADWRRRLVPLSFIAACVSTVALVLAFIFVNIGAVVRWEYQVGSFNTVFTIASWAPWVIFTTATLAFLLGVAAMQKNSAIGRAKALAGWGIALSVLIALLEITVLLSHVFIY